MSTRPWPRSPSPPAPDTVLRVHMVFLPLEQLIEIPEQQLTPTERKGFTVVEWGGTDASYLLPDSDPLIHLLHQKIPERIPAQGFFIVSQGTWSYTPGSYSSSGSSRP